LSGLFSCFVGASGLTQAKTGQPEQRKSKSLWRKKKNPKNPMYVRASFGLELF
jgi:hypothetical protein